MDFLLSLIVSFITQFLKRFGIQDDGDHIAILIMALIASLWQFGLKWMPAVYTTSIAEIWAGSVFFYEVILKRISLFRKLGGKE